jgi:hypothetical protein
MSIVEPVILFTIPLPILLRSVVPVEDDEPFADEVVDAAGIEGVVWVLVFETLETIETLLRSIP